MKTAAAAVDTRKNAITGVVVSYLSRPHMEAAAKEAGITLPAGNDEQTAVNLYTHYLGKVGGDSGKLLECEDCLGRSLEDLKQCPYCRGKPTEKAETTTTGPAAGKPGTLKEAKKTMDKAAGKQTALALAGDTAMTKVGSGALANRSEKDLDKAVKRVFELKVQSAMGMWELGREIANIRDNQLWKLRNGENGKPKYKTAEAFITAELNMSVIHAWNLAKVAKEYGAGAVEKFGPTKLGLVLQAPPEARPAIQAKVESGAGSKEIKTAVKQANKGRATVTTNTGKEVVNPQAAREAKAAKAAKDEGRKTLTIANVLGSQTLKLYKKASMQGEDKKEWTLAKRVADVPHCTMVLENDVVQEFTVLDGGDGTLRLKIVTKRV